MKKDMPIIKKYLKEYQENYKEDEILDFYQLFGISESIQFHKLKDYIKEKKIRNLFHPDDKMYIPECDREDFIELGNKVIAIIDNDFSDEEKRKNYDSKLKIYRQEKENSSKKQKKNKGADFNKSMVSDVDKEKLDKASRYHILKYGFENTLQSFQHYFISGSVEFFTQSQGARNIIKNLGPKVIANILESYNNDSGDIDYNKVIIYYFIDLMSRNQDIYKKLLYYVKACTETISKYNQVFGYENQGFIAIQGFIANKDNAFNNFTRDNNARQLLMENVHPCDGKILTYIYLSYFKDYSSDCNWDNLSRLSDDELALLFYNFLRKQMNLEEVYYRKNFR